jgi:hypothetical protein
LLYSEVIFVLRTISHSSAARTVEIQSAESGRQKKDMVSFFKTGFMSRFQIGSSE